MGLDVSGIFPDTNLMDTLPSSKSHIRRLVSHSATRSRNLMTCLEQQQTLSRVYLSLLAQKSVASPSRFLQRLIDYPADKEAVQHNPALVPSRPGIISRVYRLLEVNFVPSNEGVCWGCRSSSSLQKMFSSSLKRTGLRRLAQGQ